MARTIQVKRDEKSDMLTAEILETGTNGVVQIRAVVPMKRIRALLDSAIADKTGRPVATVSGSPAIQRRCGPLVSKLAGIQLFRVIAKAAQSPVAEQAKRRAIQMAMVARLVSIAESDEFEDEYGGWEGIQAAQAKKRKARYRALIARGVPEPAARKLIMKSKHEDDMVLRAAMAEVNTEDDEDEADELAEEAEDEMTDTSPEPKVFISGDRDGRDAKVGASHVNGSKAARQQARKQAQTIDVPSSNGEPIDAANPPRN